MRMNYLAAENLKYLLYHDMKIQPIHSLVGDFEFFLTLMKQSALATDAGPWYMGYDSLIENRGTFTLENMTIFWEWSSLQ